MTTRIVQITDLHLFRDPEERLFGIPTRELLRDVLAHVAEDAGRVDHLVITGDHTHDDLPETYEALREMLAPWLDRLWQLPGNHDARAVLRSIFPDRIGGEGNERLSFSFGTGDWLCLGLDTQVTGEIGGRFDEEQLEWIRARLHEHDPQGAVLFMHHPPVTTGRDWLDRIGLAGKELLRGLLVEEPRIRLVCCGHIHHELAERVGRAEVVTTPSTGLQFSPTSPTVLYVQAPPGYRLVELGENGYTTRVVRLPDARYVPEQK
jgi:Icc protein